MPTTPSTSPEPAKAAMLRDACRLRRKLRLHYRDLQAKVEEIDVRPLGVFCWNGVWLLGAWVDAKHDFRSFRIDHLESARLLDDSFDDEPGRTLADLLRLAESEMSERGSATDA